jgi:long-chain acyl-CoA synthetase
VLVVGDRKPYVAALITVDPDSTRSMSASDVNDAVQGAVDSVNAERSRYEQIKRFTVLPREFSLEEDEVTPTLKLRRKVILDHFAREFAGLYD